MDIYATTVNDLPAKLRNRIMVVRDATALSRRIANEFADALAARTRQREMLTVILPVGPLDYGYFAAELRRRRLTARYLRTINMDEYLNGKACYIPLIHPLSFRRFMQERFFSQLPADQRPLPENMIFPDPRAPHKVTELIDRIGGADLCWNGFGITGHIAFNDPPSMLGESTSLRAFRNCKTRNVTNAPMSQAQMAMGGTNGNLDILPTRAITIGMYELLKTKHIHCVFMRRWHAGLWRRAFLGKVTSEFPGSLLQEHPHVTITMTRLAAAVPLINTTQATGEEKDSA